MCIETERFCRNVAGHDYSCEFARTKHRISRLLPGEFLKISAFARDIISFTLYAYFSTEKTHICIYFFLYETYYE